MFGGKDALGEQTQGLGVSFKTTVFTIQMIQGFFSRMTKGWVTKIVREADGLNEVGIDEKMIGEWGVRWIFRFEQPQASG